VTLAMLSPLSVPTSGSYTLALIVKSLVTTGGTFGSMTGP
jgi:hypothetical protein